MKLSNSASRNDVIDSEGLTSIGSGSIAKIADLGYSASLSSISKPS